MPEEVKEEEKLDSPEPETSEEDEKIGLDISEHGIEAYPDYAMSGSGVGNR